MKPHPALFHIPSHKESLLASLQFHLQEMGTPSITTQKPSNQDVNLRTASRLADKSQNVTDDLIVTIFSKIQVDPRTLIPCSSVSKYWASLVSRLDTLSLRFFIPVEDDDDDSPCLQSHHHIPTSAVPALMKVFENMKSLEIKLCFCQPSRDHSFRLKATLAGPDVRSYLTCVSVPSVAGLLTTSSHAASSLEAELGDRGAHISSFLDSCTLLLKNRPKILASLVIMGAKVQRFESGGLVFMTKEQILNLCGLCSKSRVNQSWLENPENVVYWLKNPPQNEHWLMEKVWVVYQWELILNDDYEPNDVRELIPEEIDVNKLLVGLVDDA